ncbi:hypothetical protein QZM48_31515, partial [Burkholderia orbicola]|uniref:hypothetical protein n=1 Tax=Burkholderia orbicola TaxID=2978683 RepID=UPI002655B290
MAPVWKTRPAWYAMRAGGHKKEKGRSPCGDLPFNAVRTARLRVLDCVITASLLSSKQLPVLLRRLLQPSSMPCGASWQR